MVPTLAQVNQEREEWVLLLDQIVMLLDICVLAPRSKAQMFDIIYSVFPLRFLQGIVAQYSGCIVNGIARDLVSRTM